MCAALLLLAIGEFLLLGPDPREDPLLEGDSPVEGRLCGDRAYALASQVRRGKAQPPASRGPRGPSGGRDAYRRLRSLIARAPSKAVRLLEREALESPREARIWSDLSVAYMARARHEQRPEDRVRALSAAVKALRLAPDLLEATYNRALALEKLSLKGAATTAWKTYEDMDPASAWGREAKERREILSRPAFWQSWEVARKRLEAAAFRRDAATVHATARFYPQPTREYIETRGLGAWADAMAAGDGASAERALWLAEAASIDLTEATGDLLLQDSVAVIRRAAADPAGGRLADLVRGHRSFRDGRVAYDKLDLETAAPLFESARLDLEKGGSPFAGWSVFYRAVCFYPRGEYEAALEGFERILRSPGHADHPILQSYAEWMTGVVLSNRAQLGDSLDHYGRGLQLAEQTRQAQNAASLHDLLATDLNYLGNSKGSWEHLAQALAGSEKVSKRRWVVTILQKAAAAALRMNQPDAAFELHDEAVRVALQQDNPLVVSEALVSRSLSRHRLNDTAGALRDLEEARRWMDRNPDSPMRRVVEAQLESALGKALRDREPSRAATAFTRALGLFHQRGSRTLGTELYAERGRCRLSLGRDDLAEEDFMAGITDFEQNRRRIFEEGLRISYFEQVRPVFDEMVRLQIDRRNDPWRALRLSEQARGRELLDTLTGGMADRLLGSLESGRAGRELPADLALVHYAVLEDRTLIWVLTRDASERFERRAGAEDLERRVRALVGAIRKREGEDRIRPLAASLYDDLVRPLAGSLPPEATLVLAPDRILHELPFAALYDSGTGRYLLEDHPVAVTPSTILALQSAGSRHRPHPVPELRRALVVGNPEIDSLELSGLPPLPGSEKEAREVAALYPEAQVLIGAAATKERFLDALGRYQVVHFGGHATSNEELPLLSMLVLAPDPASGRSGALLAHEIYGRQLRETRLVVLAACSTARARISPGEGVLSLARPFLAAGVPHILSTLWEVEDSTAPVFFESFHRRLRTGDSPVQALRAAQLALLADARPDLRSPASWAPFEVIQGMER